MDIKPAVKNEKHFQKWVADYPLYANVNREGVNLYDAAKLLLAGKAYKSANDCEF